MKRSQVTSYVLHSLQSLPITGHLDGPCPAGSAGQTGKREGALGLSVAPPARGVGSGLLTLRLEAPF